MQLVSAPHKFPFQKNPRNLTMSAPVRRRITKRQAPADAQGPVGKQTRRDHLMSEWAAGLQHTSQTSQDQVTVIAARANRDYEADHDHQHVTGTAAPAPMVQNPYASLDNQDEPTNQDEDTPTQNPETDFESMMAESTREIQKELLTKNDDRIISHTIKARGFHPLPARFQQNMVQEDLVYYAQTYYGITLNDNQGCLAPTIETIRLSTPKQRTTTGDVTPNRRDYVAHLLVTFHSVKSFQDWYKTCIYSTGEAYGSRERPALVLHNHTAVDLAVLIPDAVIMRKVDIRKINIHTDRFMTDPEACLSEHFIAALCHNHPDIARVANSITAYSIPSRPGMARLGCYIFDIIITFYSRLFPSSDKSYFLHRYLENLIFHNTNDKGDIISSWSAEGNVFPIAEPTLLPAWRPACNCNQPAHRPIDCPWHMTTIVGMTQGIQEGLYNTLANALITQITNQNVMLHLGAHSYHHRESLPRNTTVNNARP